MFWDAIGIGIGVGIFHASLLFVVLVLVRTPAKTQAKETLELMRERNELDRQKVAALEFICEVERAKVGL